MGNQLIRIIYPYIFRRRFSIPLLYIWYLFTLIRIYSGELATLYANRCCQMVIFNHIYPYIFSWSGNPGSGWLLSNGDTATIKVTQNSHLQLI